MDVEWLILAPVLIVYSDATFLAHFLNSWKSKEIRRISEYFIRLLFVDDGSFQAFLVHAISIYEYSPSWYVLWIISHCNATFFPGTDDDVWAHAPIWGIHKPLQTYNEVQSAGNHHYGSAYRALVRGVFSRQELATHSCKGTNSKFPALDAKRLSVAQRKCSLLTNVKSFIFACLFFCHHPDCVWNRRIKDKQIFVAHVKSCISSFEAY
jgi:hypothetical protein